MDISVNINRYAGDTLATAKSVRENAVSAPRPAPASNRLPVPTEDAAASLPPQAGTRLVKETREDLNNGGFRRMQLFEREDGRSFTRIEEFALTSRGSKRGVTQQNPSGSITQYEEILDRQEDGGFRRTQRFQDESGAVSAQITPDYPVTDPFILTNGQSSLPYGGLPPFASSRGTQLDLSA